MKYFTVFILLALVAPVLFSQSVSIDQLDKKSRKRYEKALKCFKNGEQAEGVKKLEEVVGKYPGFQKGSEKLAGIYLDNEQNDKAIALLNTMMSHSGDMDPRLAMSISYPLEQKQDYSTAVSMLDDLLASGVLSDNQREQVQKRKDELVFREKAYANPLPFTPQRMSAQINTDDIEYHPAFNADGSMMIFVKVSGGKFKNEDLYFSRRITKDSLSKAEPIAALNTPAQEGAFSFSQDGKTLVFTACEWKDSYGGCDLYISFNSGSKWSDPVNMGPVINSEYWDSSPALSTDGRTLYYSSKRPGGSGGADIWMVQLNSQNKWAAPINLGPEINTKGNEETPYLHPDNSTLYFVSDGHIGLGSYDLFMSSKGANQNWATPENMGYPINTPNREGGLFVDLAGDKAYYASQIDLASQDSTYRSGDIYYFDLPTQYKPNLVTYLKVIIRDWKTKGLINAQAQLINLDEQMSHSNVNTTVSGSLLTTIVPGDYALNVSRQNYVFHSENIKLKDGTDITDPFVYEIYLRPIEVEVSPAEKVELPPIVLNNIFFETASASLLKRSDAEINNLIALMSGNENLRIKIIGHTDNVGNDIDNKKLSTDRAKAVYDRLVVAGVARTRLAYEGRGESQPIADNTTQEGRQKNRRTEFIVLP